MDLSRIYLAGMIMKKYKKMYDPLVPLLKVAFFQKVQCVFQISKSPKKIFQITILSLKFKFPANNSKVLLARNLNFKFRIVFRNIFLEIWRFGKRIALSEKKPPLVHRLEGEIKEFRIFEGTLFLDII